MKTRILGFVSAGLIHACCEQRDPYKLSMKSTPNRYINKAPVLLSSVHHQSPKPGHDKPIRIPKKTSSVMGWALRRQLSSPWFPGSMIEQKRTNGS